MSPRLRLLLVEDDRWLLRSMAEALAAAEPDLELTTAGTAREALAAASRVSPGAALVDLGLPDRSGCDVIAALRRMRPPCVAVALTVFDDAPTILAALRAGARGYLLKSTPTDRVLPALRDALAGGMPLSPTVARLVVERVLAGDAAHSPPLTPRESELLALLARGATYAECAGTLGIGIGTVQTHVKAIYAKLEVRSKAEAAVVATRRGLVS